MLREFVFCLLWYGKMTCITPEALIEDLKATCLRGSKKRIEYVARNVNGVERTAQKITCTVNQKKLRKAVNKKKKKKR